MKALLAFSRGIDSVSRWFGYVATWLVLLATFVSAANAFLGYGTTGLLWLAGSGGTAGNSFTWIYELYKSNSNTLRDLQLTMFAGMVMLGAAWTLKVNEHVRVDLAYTSVSDRARLWIDLSGILLFLMPFCILMIYISWPWFLQTWTDNELSQDAGGMPRWPLKLFVPFGFGLLLLQGISELIKCIAAMTSDYKREHAYEKPIQ